MPAAWKAALPAADFCDSLGGRGSYMRGLHHVAV